MSKLTVLFKGKAFSQVSSPDELAELIELSDAPASDYSLVPAELRAGASAQMLAAVDGYRRKLTSIEAGLAEASPERVAVWRTKAALARGFANPADIPDALRVHLEREAAAGGVSLDALMGVIKAKADAFDGLGLMIDAMEAEAKAGLAALPLSLIHI